MLGDPRPRFLTGTFLSSGRALGKNVALRPDFSVDKRVQRTQQLQHPNALNQRLPLPIRLQSPERSLGRGNKYPSFNALEPQLTGVVFYHSWSIM